MNIDDRLHEAGLHWRESQGPALRAPRLDASSEKAPSRRWMSGLVPLAASLAVAAMVIGVVTLNGAPTGNPAPGATSTRSPTSSPAPTPTASTSPQTPQPTGTTGPLTTTGNPAESLVVTEEIRGQLLQAGAALHGLPVSAFTGFVSGLTYYAYDPATATYWAGAGLMPSSSSLRAQVSVQDNGSYLLFRRPADKPWTGQDVGLAGVAGTKCPTSVPASVLTVWNWPARSCRPASIASIVPPSSVPTATSDLPRVIFDCTSPPPQGQQAQVEPTAITVACADNGIGVQDVVWTSWTPTSASGTGTVWEKTCKPDCARGPIEMYPASISVSGVKDTSVGMLFTAMTVTYQGTGPNGHTTDQFGLPWPRK